MIYQRIHFVSCSFYPSSLAYSFLAVPHTHTRCISYLHMFNAPHFKTTHKLKFQFKNNLKFLHSLPFTRKFIAAKVIMSRECYFQRRISCIVKVECNKKSVESDVNKRRNMRSLSEFRINFGSHCIAM